MYPFDSRTIVPAFPVDDATFTAEFPVSFSRDGLREVVQLTFYEDLSQTEVARRLGISQMQVSRRLRAATAELHKIITQKSKKAPEKKGSK